LSAPENLSRRTFERSADQARIMTVVLGHIPDQDTEHEQRDASRAHNFSTRPNVEGAVN
jgi:hypothetical protein